VCCAGGCYGTHCGRTQTRQAGVPGEFRVQGSNPERVKPGCLVSLLAGRSVSRAVSGAMEWEPCWGLSGCLRQSVSQSIIDSLLRTLFGARGLLLAATPFFPSSVVAEGD
jgi:hypothetical protein